MQWNGGRGCGVPAGSQDAGNEPRTNAVSETVDGAENSSDETTRGEETDEHNILIAYFTRLDNRMAGLTRSFREEVLMVPWGIRWKERTRYV